MNCHQLEEMLPLYVGGEVEPARANRIAAHLQSCAACSQSLHEYGQARQLLVDFAPPTFDDAIYDGIRANVLRQIRTKSKSRSTSPLLSQLLQPRLGWAFATALLVALLATAYVFVIRSRNASPAQQANSNQTEVAPAKKDFAVRQPNPNANDSRPPNKTADVAVTSQFKHRRRVVVRSPESMQIAVKTPFTISPSQSITPSSTGANVAPLADLNSETTLRMEMQTADPNIRIIWFSNQHARADSPGESSKGT